MSVCLHAIVAIVLLCHCCCFCLIPAFTFTFTFTFPIVDRPCAVAAAKAVASGVVRWMAFSCFDEVVGG